ncbi:hypothetical protein CH063_08696 [Colletotrichum higginsianum]|uniref:Uncharacterized protein n=1 Tax=Colletotrichum higginsianum (strain IMI 349063) TaxID=759273 RepID=H1VAS9_COLHI|nr:hypothetical protein CH063_08696 [Colletotrichum higginsianum]
MHTANSIQPGGFNLRWRGIVLPHSLRRAMLSLDIVVLPPRTRPTPCPVKLRSPQILVCFPFLCIHCNSVDKSHPTPLLDPTTTTN